jgi:septal ring factor EnvC (AmiA/AmiB activator)
MQHKIIIARHRPGVRAALIGAVACVLAVGAFALYQWTRAKTVSDFERTQTELEQLRLERRELVRDLRAARSEIDDLKGQLVYERRSTEIDQQSCDSVRTSLGSLQAEVSDLNEQLAFYRGIVSPELSRVGVRIYAFRLSQTAASDTFRYDLTLIQAVRHNRKIAGRIQIQVEGQLGGSRRTFSLSELATDPGHDLTFSFKYFEEISGELRIPAGFRPEQVTVTLAADAGSEQNVREQFDWNKAFKGQP